MSVGTSGKVQFGPYLLPPEAVFEHFLFLGATGSGKTTLISMLQESALSTTGSLCRALVYDAKGEAVAHLWSMLNQSTVPSTEPSDLGRIKVLDPFCAFGVAWDIAADVPDEVGARQLASILIPDTHSSDGSAQFFNEACREILMASMLLLKELAPNSWTFKDLILLSLDTPLLELLLSNSETYTCKRVGRTYLSRADAKTKANVVSSLSAKVGVYGPIAQAWTTAKERYSISRWSTSNDFLVLGNNPRGRSSVDPINRAVFQRATEVILDLPEVPKEDRVTPSARTWFFLDEFREAGKLEGLRRLLNQGRSKGACVVLGSQDIEGVRKEYGREEADEILGQCSHIAVLGLNNPGTAEWAASVFGSGDVGVESTGNTIGTSYSENRSLKQERRTSVTTKELLTMPRTNPRNGLTGYYRSPFIDNSEALKTLPEAQKICPWRFDSTDRFSWTTAVEPTLPISMRSGSTSISAFARKRPAAAFTVVDWSASEKTTLFGQLSIQPSQTDAQDFEPAR